MELVPINFAAFRKLIDGAICGVQVVSCDGLWRKEYFTYNFDPPQRPASSNVLDHIYRFELMRRIPRVEAGP
jgi:hypothetical protein